MERRFNKEQEAVIQATGGRHLVLAPPGCGKTAVLAERIVEAHRRGVPFTEMACLTFTNRASRGMKERIDEVLGGVGAEELFIGNVHRFCSQFLFDNDVVPEGTTIIDTDVSMSIIADYLGEDELRILGDNKERNRYSGIINLQHLMYQCCRHYPSQLMVHRNAMSPQALHELCLAFGLPYSQQSTIALYEHADDYVSQPKLLSAEANRLLHHLYAARHYELYKREHDLLDFEDLLLWTYDAMASRPTERRFSWIQVDEVQDLNPLQLEIIDQLTAPDATVVYLGDPQQAIFSFMGAKTDTLEKLRQRCGAGGLHNFFQNYRSPRYLLDVYNRYGEQQLGISPELLPQTQDTTPCQPGDLALNESYSNADEANAVAQLVGQLYRDHPDETTAVVVAFNSDADEVSRALRLPHFKISGVDLFTTADVRLLLAHLSVVATELDFIGWSRILTGLRIFQSNSASRQFVHAMTDLGVAPTDLLHYEDSTYVAEFLKAYRQEDFVVFDTETTGLNVFEDDVVQIAAVRVRGGAVVAEQNLFVETARPIPAMLGDTPNPLTAEYARQPHLPHREALQQFLDFAEGAVLLGHNATFDWQMMSHNMSRYAPELSMPARWTDSLKLARLLKPRLRSYKLKSLLAELGLEGQNTHLANDDIMATLSLANWCARRASEVVGAQLDFVARHKQTALRLRNLYLELYNHSTALLYQQRQGAVLADELRYAYGYLREIGRMGEIDKLDYLTRYVTTDMLGAESGTSLAEQLAAHMQELNTMKEADLCGSRSMQERVFVSTVHKAKGLEFDNVVVYDVVDGKYPSHYADTSESQEEEARKFYVAMSRARRRLVLAYSHTYVSPWGRTFQRQLTPFLASIRQFFG